jgi:hypothetical protein
MARQIRRIEESEKTVHTSLAAAEAGKPADRKDWRLFQVTGPNGALSWIWAPAKENALLWCVCDHAKTHTVLPVASIPSKSAVATMLAGLSAEDRSELLGQYATTAKGKK